MNAPAPASLRRGACPGLSAPMATGDGLLARLTPSGTTIALDAFAGLCGAARTHGNGIVEITSRGSIQIRGLSAASSPLFAADVASLGIAAYDGIPVVTDPLAGLGRHDRFDTQALAGQLRQALAAAPFLPRLSAKVSVAVDGGGALHLDALAADIRLRAIGGAHAHVALAGTATDATPLWPPRRHGRVCVTQSRAKTWARSASPLPVSSSIFHVQQRDPPPTRSACIGFFRAMRSASGCRSGIRIQTPYRV